MKSIEFETYNIDESPEFAIIGIHGWKGNRFSLKQIAISLGLTNTKWFLPEAPYLVDNNQNQRSWSYEIRPGIWERDEPKNLMDQFMYNHVLNKYSSKKVFFMGFSQGGLMCYEYALHSPHPWAGVFPIAGFMIDQTNKNKTYFHPNQKNTPILIGHGIQDEIVRLDASKLAYNQLKANGAKNIELLTYTANHKIGIKFLRKMKKMIISYSKPE